MAAKIEVSPAVRTLPAAIRTVSRLPIHRGKTIPVSTQIMTNHFTQDNEAEAIEALITVKVEVKTQVKNNNKNVTEAYV